MRAIGYFILLVLLIAAVFFSMANRDVVSIGFWPLDVRQEAPLFLPILAALVIGFFVSGFLSWRRASSVRRQLRQAMRDHRDAAIEIDRLKAELKAAQSAPAGGVPQIAA